MHRFERRNRRTILTKIIQIPFLPYIDLKFRFSDGFKDDQKLADLMDKALAIGADIPFAFPIQRLNYFAGPDIATQHFEAFSEIWLETLKQCQATEAYIQHVHEFVVNKMSMDNALGWVEDAPTDVEKHFAAVSDDMLPEQKTRPER